MANEPAAASAIDDDERHHLEEQAAWTAVSAAFGSLGRAFVCADADFRIIHGSYVLDEVFGIRAPALTPGLRAAIRFYLTLDKNRDLLNLVLRTSSEGRSVKRDLQKNHAWIRAARARFDVGAWLAERSREVMIDGAKHVIAVEQDPVEVLRMGVPFGTCLSLDDGCNAASTVTDRPSRRNPAACWATSWAWPRSTPSATAP